MVETVQVPSVGRMVHYVAYGTPGGEFPAGVCRAAVVTEVESLDAQVGRETAKGPWLSARGPVVGLCVMNPTGLFFNRSVPYDADRKPGTWHWPERT